MTVKLSTILYLVGTILLGITVLSVGSDFPLTALGWTFLGAGLTAGSVGN